MKKFIGFITLILIFVGLFVAVGKSQEIIDWWKLRDYSPSAEIAALAVNSGMNDEGTKLFYIHDPLLIQKDNFNTYCTADEETIVLGCYISNDRIYLFDVEDEKLEGIEEVTAAHEMLHAAYDRMTTDEKEKLNILLNQQYEKVTDQKLLEVIDSYRKRDESIVNNEIHSIFGTELNELSKELEDHYAKYFDDRTKVVTLADSYEDEFRVLEDKIEEFDDQLANLQGEISRLEADIKVQLQTLSNERKRIEVLLENPSAYNSAIPGFNSLVSQYNQDIERAKSLIDQYNQIVNERNKIAVKEKELVDAIDSRQQEL